MLQTSIKDDCNDSTSKRLNAAPYNTSVQSSTYRDSYYGGNTNSNTGDGAPQYGNNNNNSSYGQQNSGQNYGYGNANMTAGQSGDAYNGNPYQPQSSYQQQNTYGGGNNNTYGGYNSNTSNYQSGGNWNPGQNPYNNSNTYTGGHYGQDGGADGSDVPPPMCNCNEPCKLVTAKTERNAGRQFFACAKNREVNCLASLGILECIIIASHALHLYNTGYCFMP